MNTDYGYSETSRNRIPPPPPDWIPPKPIRKHSGLMVGGIAILIVFLLISAGMNIFFLVNFATDGGTNPFDGNADEISRLEAEIDALESENAQLQTENDEWWSIYHLRNGDSYTEMVTPGDSSVKSKMRSILGTSANGDLSWNDRQDINDWVSENIAYSKDPPLSSVNGGSSGDYWLFPSETISRGEGDCEDHANLALSLMLAEEDVSFLYCAEVQFKNGDWHVGIFCNVEGDKLYIYDPTWKTYSWLIFPEGWHSTESMSESQALAEWASDYGGVSKVARLYTNDFEKDFSTLQEFYDWF